MKVELRSLKVHRDLSEETTAFSAVVFIDGTKAGDASNRGTGGQTDVWITDPQLRRSFEDWVVEQPPHALGALSLPLTPDLVIDLLVEEAELAKEYRRMCRNKTVFRFKGAPADEWREISVPFTPHIKAKVLEKHGDKIEEFLNDRIEGSAGR